MSDMNRHDLKDTISLILKPHLLGLKGNGGRRGLAIMSTQSVELTNKNPTQKSSDGFHRCLWF